LFISEEPPHGVTVIVLRRGEDGVEYLLLHRTQAGDGDWAWGPPAGVRLPGEDVDACAGRELDDDIGLRLAVRPIPHDLHWAAYWAEAPEDTEIRLSSEHDHYAWVALDEAIRRCQPQIVAEQFEVLAQAAAA
jgi:ADP-ribose pyrophosphatase YjhB (NUDIX family)